MRLVSWNVNGIRAVIRKEMLTPFLSSLNPDVICLQETKAQRSQVELELPDYEEHWNSAEKKGYSGTALFSKTSPLRVLHGLSTDVIAAHQVVGDQFGDPTSTSTHKV